MGKVGLYAVIWMIGFGFGVFSTLAHNRGARPAASQQPEGPREVVFSVEDGSTHRVRRVVDGDTVVLENGLLVRYQAVNTPELGRWIEDPAPLGQRAKERNAELVKDKTLVLKLAPDPVDAYGRVVARVSVREDDGSVTDIEQVLLAEGLGRPFGLGLPPAERAMLKAWTLSAQEQKLGLWGLKHPLEEGNPDGFLYCASTNGKVFHSVESPTALRIKAENFIGFKTLAEAEASGRSQAAGSRPAGGRGLREGRRSGE